MMADKPLHEQVDALREDVAARAKTVRDLEMAERRARGAVTRAQSAVEDYLRESHRRGVTPDPARLAELREAVADAKGRTRTERILTGGRLSDVVERDVEAIAALEGAQAGLEEARAALTEFERTHDVALVIERLPDRVAERDRLLRAARAFLDAESGWTAGLNVELRHARAVGRPIPDPVDPPRDVVVGMVGWLREVEADPARLLPTPVEGRAAPPRSTASSSLAT